MQKRVIASVYGNVQGVGLRDFTQATAEKLGIVGTVRNGDDGTVEIVGEGEGHMLKELLVTMGQYPYAHITKIDETWREAVGSHSDFRIIF